MSVRWEKKPITLDLRGALRVKSARVLVAEKADCERRLSRSLGIHSRVRAKTALARRERELASRLACDEPDAGSL